MALKLKSKSESNFPIDLNNKVVYEYKPVQATIPHPPVGAPTLGRPTYTYIASNVVKAPAPPPVEMQETSLPRALNYYADYGGCGFWRMVWPETAVNSYQKGCISGLTSMVLDLRFYQNLKSIRMQRQATPVQAMFIKELYKHKDSLGYQLIYEIDDIVFRNDIPDYNRCKESFASEETEKTILEIMSMMDEITVTCQYMKQYYQEKTGNKKVTIIPNYPPKYWLGRFYNRQRLIDNFEKYKKRPRILYAGSGTHIDVANKTNLKDDFAHVVKEIIAARKKFKFIWKGTYPLEIKPFIDNGEMEYIDWSPLYDLPQSVYDSNCNAVYAPLQDNVFNKSKSNIKMVEAGAFGYPGAFQDLCTYEGADLKFGNGTELIAQLEHITSDIDTYMKYSDNIHKFTNGLWLEDHLNEYEAMYFTKWGSKERNLKSPGLISLNLDQKI
jgi:hypothetical protein